MGQPFEFKNPLEGAPPRLGEQDRANPFSDGQPIDDGAITDNLYATTSDEAPDERPQYVAMLTHHGPLLLRLALFNLGVCATSSVAAMLWERTLLNIVFGCGVFGVGLAIKSGYDLAAIRAEAMDSEGRGRTLSAFVLSIVTTLLATAAIAVALLLIRR